MSRIDWLRTLHTKQLVNLKRDCTRELLYYGTATPDWSNREFKVTCEELKQVLSERPHILRKNEARGIRQTAAKQKVRSYQSPN
jgi:hypothetical protein